MILKRTCIYTRDVQWITGKDKRSCQRILRKIRAHLGKELNQCITVEEFAAYMGISVELVQSYIID
ncbi:MAG: hypothetical protein AB2L24_13275 [Mangrovibacterium sp.]